MACLLLGRKEFEFLIAVLAATLLLLVAKANSQCPQGLPLFGDRDPHNELPDNIQAILPTYTFTCSGPVVQWGACVQPQGPPERYDIYFQVWRLTGEDGCYSIVGSNRIADGDPNVPRGCIIFDVPQEQRIMVEAGDVMGFYSDHNRDNGGIEVDTAVNLDVWYRTLSNPTLSNLEDSSLCIGATGDLNTFSDSGAPVITAMVDNSQCLSSVPLFGDRDGVPRLPNSIQAIIPAYTFTCRGSVVQWGACVNPRGNNDRYDIYFEVWRPTDTNGCYSFIGSNFVDNGAPGNIHNVRACVVIDVPENQQVIVEPGDVVGFYSDHVVGNGMRNGGVESDDGPQYANLEVWYRSLSNPSQSDLEANSLCVGVGEDLNTRRTGDAPVITAVIAADCGRLTNPANGSVSLTMTTFGSMASYSCSEQSNLLGDAVRTCQANGMWNGTAPTCVVDCGSLQNPVNGMVSVTETTFGSTASYSCSGSNYLLVGTTMRTCQADGMWSGSAPECVINCGSLQDPENGMVTMTETTVGSTARYSCSGSNYILVGTAKRTCQADGMWSGSAPECVIDCGSLQNPENGMVTVTETTFGSTASYSCSGSNYLLVGAAERTCQADGMWSGSAPECVVDCGILSNPVNGMVTVTETTFGSTASYSCSGSNYLLVGAAERICQADGMWSGSAPECVIDCGSLQNPENGMVTVTETTFGSTASYSCSGSNYLLVGAAERTCQADGMWSGSAPECVIDCGSLQNPENGMVTVTETTFGSTASYSCSGSNYLLVGAAERTCQADGMWSGSAPECVIDCGSLQNPENGMVTLTETTVGSTARYSCSGSNYDLVGAAERTCQADGMWSGSAPECVIDCGSLQNPENGMVTVTETTFGSTASYLCSGSNYLLVGAAVRTCQANGMWSGSAPECVVDCGFLPNPVNGMVSVTETTVGSTASYSCNGSNYLLVGAAERTCQADGMWSGSAPDCVVDCGSLQNPTNGTVSVTGTTFGSTASYSCSGSNYLLVGAAERTCQANGMWSESVPQCNEVCDMLTSPMNGEVVFMERFVNSVANYICDIGFELDGSETRTCQSGSGWSGVEPSCEPVDCNSLANPGNGTVSVSTTTFDSMANYSCSGTRYLLVGNATRMCQANREWSGGAPACEEVCDALTNPMNGDIMFSNGTFVGSVATYSCTMGFESVGNETRTCQSGSGWSGMEPSCERMCDPLDDPVNGQVMLTTRTQGSVASYSCETGYNFTGSSSRMCQMATDGLEWSDGDPICQIVNCGTLTSPVNGMIFLDTTSFGSTVTYSCNNSDHQLVGDAMRTCQANGMWSGNAPTCDLLSSRGGVIGGVVAGVLVVIVLAVLATLVILCKKRKGWFTLHSKVKSRADTQHFFHNLENPLYSGVLTQPIYSSLTATRERVYENPDHQRPDSNYEDPEKIRFCRRMSNVPLIGRGHGTLLDTNGHYEWDIYVPTQDQRRSVASSKGRHEDIYAALGEVQKPQDTFFEESTTFWKPSSDPNELYDQLSINKYREIPRTLIQTTQHLGSGQFGSVEKGIWQTRTGAVEIAVKTLKAGASQDDEVRFLQEAAINGQFQHPNIVELLGVVTIGQPAMIVLELLSNGDLRSYLTRQQPVPGELLPSDTPHMLLQFCQEVASGMEYLSQKAFVHRDLAARNILVAADRKCKISDFGMSRDLENEPYYVSHGGKIPIKWTAPEALYFKKYSTASDVWSYGVLMYEIWSVGRKPFPNYTNQEAMKLVDSGVRLPPPPGCPKKIYKVMIHCWHPDKSSRPSFTEVVEALSEPKTDLLRWSKGDTAVHTRAAVLGAPLEAGLNLYPVLRGTYT